MTDQVRDLVPPKMTPPLDPATFILREATPAEKIACWRTNSVSWSGKLTPDDYISRETINGSGELARDGGIRYWVFTAPASSHGPSITNRRSPAGAVVDGEGTEPEPEPQPEQESVIYAAVETLRKPVVVKTYDDGGKSSEVEECSYGVASVFTPPRFRGQKVASWMMRRLAEILDREEGEGHGACRFSVLYSDVGVCPDHISLPNSHSALKITRRERMALTHASPCVYIAILPSSRLAFLSLPRDIHPIYHLLPLPLFPPSYTPPPNNSPHQNLPPPSIRA